MTMGRIEIVDELRKYTNKRQLDHALKAPTAVLRGMLARLASPAEDKQPRPPVMKWPKRSCVGIAMGMDFARPGKDMTVFSFIETFGGRPSLKLNDIQKRILASLGDRRYTIYYPRHAGKNTLRKLWRERVNEYHATKARAARLLDMGVITEEEARGMVRKCFDV